MSDGSIRCDERNEYELIDGHGQLERMKRLTYRVTQLSIISDDGTNRTSEKRQNRVAVVRLPDCGDVKEFKEPLITLRLKI